MLLHRILLESSVHREAAQLALRMIAECRWYRRLIYEGRAIDSDILRLIGLQHPERGDSYLTPQNLKLAVESQRKRYDARSWPRKDKLQSNIDRLGDMLQLDRCERDIVRVGVLVKRVSYFNDLFNHAIQLPATDLYSALAAATGHSQRQCARALRKQGNLHRCGFFSVRTYATRHDGPFMLTDHVFDALLMPNFDECVFLQRIVRRAPPPTLAMDDFSHVADLGAVQRYLAGIGRDKGANVLLYGAPGTGKTEFVRTLAASLDRTLHEVPNEDAQGDAIAGQARFSAYAMCQAILGQHQEHMVLFDEVEDVFGTEHDVLGKLFGHHTAEGARKSWVNELLESNPVPTLWVSNNIHAMDAAFLRRFDMVVELRPPGCRVRRRLVDRYFRAGVISNACAERIAGIELLPPAQIERAAKVVRRMKLCSQSQRDTEVERVLRGSLQAMGMTGPLRTPVLPAHYDPVFVQCKTDLSALATNLSRHRSAHLCLYGPPGTGKTAYAHHLGRVLDAPVVVKRASDLLSKYLGDTEQQIAAAFNEAKQDDAILLIDEADSFLRDRSCAVRSWEVTQVNELLTQMDAFDGIFIASTNLLDSLDAASLRRFDFKLKFDYLSRDQRRALVSRVSVADSEASPLDRAWTLLDQLDAITPGDVANALRQCTVTGHAATASRLVELLAAEQAIKPECRSRPIGFLS
ncbi:MAG: ATP-binding protein [Xanthomonadales bacterium]|nr:ATP-binding protein [Xanthomonadales bacterium]